jgi:hypothetical protein
VSSLSSAAQSSLNGAYGWEHRNRQNLDQWEPEAIICAQPWTEGVLWSSSRGAGGAMGGVYGARADAGSMSGFYDVNLDDSGNSSHKRITGTARDGGNAGAVFPSGATIKAVLTATDVVQGTCTADSAGYYECPTREAGAHYITAYYASVPPKTGYTANNLTPT